MRRAPVIAVSFAVLAAALLASLAPAGGQSPGVEYTFEVIKDVHGDGPSSGFVVDYECLDSGGGVITSGSLNFDNLVDGNESQVVEVDVDDQADCSIVESNSNGADLVEYECEFFPGPDDVTAPEGTAEGCTTQQSVHFNSQDDFGSFLVRNTFEPDVLPDDDEPPAVEPDVVAGSPSFTG